MPDYYRENYNRAKAQEAAAEREGDCVAAEAWRRAAIRWLEQEERIWDGEPEEGWDAFEDTLREMDEETALSWEDHETGEL